MVNKHYKSIVAKLDNEEQERWLPLWMHHMDTAGIMKKLVRYWLPESIIKACGIHRDEFLKLAVFLGATHDCGKATSYFQSVITRKSPELFERINDSGLLVKKFYQNEGKTNHAYMGQCILQNGVEGCKVEETLAEVVGAHHGKPMNDSLNLIDFYPANFYGEEHNDEQKKSWTGIWMEIIGNALCMSDINSVSEIPSINTSAQVLLSGLLIVADWLASNTAYFPLISLDDIVGENIYPDRVDAAWNKCKLPEGWESETNIADTELFEERFAFMPNEIQSSVMKIVNNCLEPGLFILEAQMGCGKTEAALSMAEVIANKKECSGMFFALPTQATSNGIYPRLYEWAEKVSEETKSAIELAHSGAMYNEEFQKQREIGKALVDNIDNEKGELTVHPWFQGNKKVLLANFVIGTIDQFLMGALKKKHFMLRHLGLAGKIVIIDECHAYDAYMNTYLDRMLEWLSSYKIPVILLSATLPVQRRNELVGKYVKCREDAPWKHETGYPLLTWTDGESVHNKVIEYAGKKKNVNLKLVDANKDMIKILNDSLVDGGCACVIANTVKHAQKYYEMITEGVKDSKVILYHAQFLMPDRVIKEQELIKKMGKNSPDTERHKLILVGTQVLEQSLDYDADIMFTELCPMDLLLQRVGRLHRHERENVGISRPNSLKVPVCYILMQETEDGDFEYDSGSRKIYHDYLLTRTRNCLPEILKLPDDIPSLVQTVYNENDDLGYKENKEYLEMCEEHFRIVDEKKAKAKTYLIKKPKKGIVGILENCDKSTENDGECQVRDAEMTIEIILLKDFGDGNAGFLHEEMNRKIRIPKSNTPDENTAREIMKQRIRLPRIFSSVWMADRTINELENFQKKELPNWQKSSWLAGELILLLDENGEAILSGYKLTYDFSKGLVYEKQEGLNEG